MADLKGTIFVTGTNGGLGSAIVSKIISSPELSANYYGIYTVRKVETATALNQALASVPSTHSFDKVALDLSTLSNVRGVANAINRRVAEGSLPPIRALILNAGYQEHTTHDFSPDGFDMTFQSNYLSHWLLTLMLLQSMDKEHGRVVVLGSWLHDPADPRNNSMGVYHDEKWKVLFHDTESLAKGTWSSTKEDPTMNAGFRRYGAAKLCEVMMIHELQKRLDSDPALSNISILGVDPGGMPSGIARRGNFLFTVVLRYLLPLLATIMTALSPNGSLRTTTKSANDVVRAAFDTEALGERPKDLYLNGTDPLETSVEARDPNKREALWRDSVGYAGLRAEETALVNWK